MSCGSALTNLFRGSSCILVDKALEELLRHLLCAVASSAGCTRAAQSPVHIPHPENSVLKPQLEPLPSSWQAFLSLEKKAVVLTKWLSDTTASHLI